MMPYSEEARKRRKCTGTTAAGRPCNAWALWGDPRQLCVNHAGRHRRGKYGGPRKSTKTHRTPCSCAAYAWPHRPGGGLCRWPLPPLDDALSGDAAARTWLSKYLVGQVGNTLERLAAAELAGRTIDDGIAEMAAEMAADATVSKTILTTTDLIRALRDAG
ncbi:MAG: hypothetical protein NTY19_43080 [Planctomycetota bacterium]|nr:hypothetical protein [Planctomycetota bacterium]